MREGNDDVEQSGELVIVAPPLAKPKAQPEAFAEWISAPPGTPLPGGLTLHGWGQWGQTLHQGNVRFRWKLIDWLIHAERKWGQTYHQLAEQTGFAPDYLRQMAWVGEATLSVRTDDSALYALSPSFHELVASAGVSDDDKRVLLRTMLDRSLTKEQSRELVKTYRTLAAADDTQTQAVVESMQRNGGSLSDEQLRQLRYDAELRKLPEEQREAAMNEARAIVGHGKDLLADLRHVVKRRLKQCPAQPTIPDHEPPVETQFVGGSFGAVGDAVQSEIAETQAVEQAVEQAVTPIARLMAASRALRSLLLPNAKGAPAVEEWLEALAAYEDYSEEA